MLFIPYRGRSFANGYAKVRWQGSHYPEGYKRYPNGLGLRGAKPSTHDCQAERMFDGLSLITCYLRSEKLVDNFKIGCHNGSALFQLVPCEWVKK